jgi:hypothetical protein
VHAPLAPCACPTGPLCMPHWPPVHAPLAPCACPTALPAHILPNPLASLVPASLVPARLPSPKPEKSK